MNLRKRLRNKEENVSKAKNREAEQAELRA